MHATLDVYALKSFTKALLCLSKYGDEVSFRASSTFLTLSATNSSKSAYCHFRFAKAFFSRYRLDTDDDTDVSIGQVSTKSLLSIMKHRTIEKSVERCEISISDQPNEDADVAMDKSNIEGKLIVRLHCKHGVIKTHRLLLMTPGPTLVPHTTDQSIESQLVIGPRALKEMIEHFPAAKGIKSDPQLTWTFAETEVGLRSLDTNLDARGKGQLSTELTINASEFDGYSIHAPPITLSFHLREFNATVAYADAMNVSLLLRFTDSNSPLCIEIDGESDSLETLFVISTSQVHGAPSRATPKPVNNVLSGSKRERDNSSTPAASRKLIRAAQPMEHTIKAECNMRLYSRTPTPPIPRNLLASNLNLHPTQDNISQHAYEESEHSHPLFLPSPPCHTNAISHQMEYDFIAGGAVENLSSSFQYMENKACEHTSNNAGILKESEMEPTQDGKERFKFLPLFRD